MLPKPVTSDEIAVVEALRDFYSYYYSERNPTQQTAPAICGIFLNKLKARLKNEGFYYRTLHRTMDTNDFQLEYFKNPSAGYFEDVTLDPYMMLKGKPLFAIRLKENAHIQQGRVSEMLHRFLPLIEATDVIDLITSNLHTVKDFSSLTTFIKTSVDYALSTIKPK